MPVESSDGLLAHHSVWTAEHFGQTSTYVQSAAAVATRILPQNPLFHTGSRIDVYRYTTRKHSVIETNRGGPTRMADSTYSHFTLRIQ